MRAGKVRRFEPIVKKTTGGKFSFKLHYNDREEVSSFFMGFLERESASLLMVTISKDVYRHTFYSLANEFFIGNHSKFFSTRRYERFTLNRAEALCFLVLTQGCALIDVQDVRAKLHQLLS